MAMSVDSFLESVARGDLPAVRDALKSDPSLAAARDRQLGSTALHYAAHRGRLEIVKLLLDHDADPGAVERGSGTTALHWAAEGGEPEVVKLLLARGAALERRDEWFGLTPLGWATVVVRVKRAGQDRAGAARVLREAGAASDAFVEIARDDQDALRRLIVANPSEMARRLGFAGDEMQPLHWAGAYGKVDALQVLMELGADTRARTTLGLTPLGSSLQRAHSESADVLVRFGVTGDESTAVVGGFVSALELTPADVLTKDLASRLLFVAAAEGHADMVAALVARGADPKLRLRRLMGEVPMMATALHAAAEAGHEKAVKALLDAGAPIDAGNEDGAPTPLHFAASDNREPVVRLLLDRGADRSARDRGYDGTPADWAAAFGHRGLASLLRGQS